MHGLKARKFRAADQMIGSISCCLEMEDMLEHPTGLSSGQKQRVALVRAVVRSPPVSLFDEPSKPPLCVGAAAGVTRTQGPATRIRLHHDLVVTHDQVEASRSRPPWASWTPAWYSSLVRRTRSSMTRPTFSSRSSSANRTSTPCAEPHGSLTGACGSRSVPFPAGCTPCHQRGRRHPGHRGHPAAGAGSRPIRRRASPLRGLFEHCSSSPWRPARSPSMEEGIVVLTAVAESYGPEQPVVVTAPPERVYLFDIDSGEHCDDQALQ